MTVREFKLEDLAEVGRWAQEFTGGPPDISQVPETSFVCVENDTILAFLSVILTNVKSHCYVENLFGNPYADSGKVKMAVETLNVYVGKFAKALQYRGILILAPTEILMRRYRRLGFKQTLGGVSTMFREVQNA